jgi:hypothetical protein
MNFEDYVFLIKESVCESGYERFLPSLCLSEGTNDTMSVLQTELSGGGEEVLAKEWAGEFADSGTTIFLAYRCGGGKVSVIEIFGFDVLRKITIAVEPHAIENDCGG